MQGVRYTIVEISWQTYGKTAASWHRSGSPQYALAPAAVGQRSGSSTLHTVLNAHLTPPMRWSNSLLSVQLYFTVTWAPFKHAYTSKNILACIIIYAFHLWFVPLCTINFTICRIVEHAHSLCFKAFICIKITTTHKADIFHHDICDSAWLSSITNIIDRIWRI